MPKFSQISEERLATCHKDLRVLLRHVIQDYDCTVIFGHRNEEDQNKAVAEGKSKLLWPLSTHNKNPSWGIDVAPYEGTGIDWGKLQSVFFQGYVLGIADQLFRIGVMTHRIRLGIDWDNDRDIDDTTFWDGCHFELIPNENER